MGKLRKLLWELFIKIPVSKHVFLNKFKEVLSILRSQKNSRDFGKIIIGMVGRK